MPCRLAARCLGCPLASRAALSRSCSSSALPSVFFQKSGSSRSTSSPVPAAKVAVLSDSSAPPPSPRESTTVRDRVARIASRSWFLNASVSGSSSSSSSCSAGGCFAGVDEPPSPSVAAAAAPVPVVVVVVVVEADGRVSAARLLLRALSSPRGGAAVVAIRRGRDGLGVLLPRGRRRRRRLGRRGAGVADDGERPVEVLVDRDDEEVLGEEVGLGPAVDGLGRGGGVVRGLDHARQEVGREDVGPRLARGGRGEHGVPEDAVDEVVVEELAVLEPVAVGDGDADRVGRARVVGIHERDRRRRRGALRGRRRIAFAVFRIPARRRVDDDDLVVVLVVREEHRARRRRWQRVALRRLGLPSRLLRLVLVVQGSRPLVVGVVAPPVPALDVHHFERVASPVHRRRRRRQTATLVVVAAPVLLLLLSRACEVVGVPHANQKGAPPEVRSVGRRGPHSAERREARARPVG
mmetsp:Transcript_9860/g.40082  ORF Transcript_9860/g.40082 Transcript_9860/m.40082 type:complete len:466 (-) Transcript_9860:503-1900(-)